MSYYFEKPCYNKYNNKKTVIDGFRFDSKKEAKRYAELKILKEKKEILFFLMQVPFWLPGKVKYVLDFMVFHKDGAIKFEDVKGYKTRAFINKKKQIEEIYQIKIDII